RPRRSCDRGGRIRASRAPVGDVSVRPSMGPVLFNPVNRLRPAQHKWYILWSWLWRSRPQTPARPPTAGHSWRGGPYLVTRSALGHPRVVPLEAVLVEPRDDGVLVDPDQVLHPIAVRHEQTLLEIIARRVHVGGVARVRVGNGVV